MDKRNKLVWLALEDEYRSSMIQQGVGRFVSSHNGWNMLPGSRDLHLGVIASLRDVGMEGLIIEAGRRDLAMVASSFDIPTVNLHGGKPFSGLPQVGSDDLAIGKMAGEYLTGQGYENYAYCGLKQGGVSGSRWVGFRDALRRRNLSAERFCWYKTYPPADYTGRLFIEEALHIIHFLSSLPKPVAVFCVNDLVASWVIDACRALELEVPTEVAILGVNNDVGFHPPSSISLPNEQVGYEAASLLDRLMRGEKPPDKPILLPPEEVVVRRSTDFLAVEDPEVARAIQFIRDHGTEGITVDDVLTEVGISRTGLDNKFKEILHHSVFQEIRRVQIDRAKHLLRETEKAMDDIAVEAGFGSSIHLSIEFKKNTSLPPTAYRRQFRRT